MKTFIENIKIRVESGDYRFSLHAVERCAERNISPSEIKEAILTGEVIEVYPEDKYSPSCLILGVTKQGRILHVQCSIDPIWIITGYDPTLNPEKWDHDFRTRRNGK